MSAPSLDIARCLADGMSHEEVATELVADGMSEDDAREYLRAWLAGEQPWRDDLPPLDGELASGERWHDGER
jgi:hypothetical protein